MNDLLKKHYEGPGGVREMLVIALPMVASNACDTVMIFTDRLFLSRLGSEQMSAAMGGGLTCFMLATFFMGLTRLLHRAGDCIGCCVANFELYAAISVGYAVYHPDAV